MKKKQIGVIASLMVGLVIIIVFLGAYHQLFNREYVPAADEIALHLQLNTAEDIGLIVFDYQVNDHAYSGGISNADQSLLKRNSDNIVVWNQKELNSFTDTITMSMRFRIITEYTEPNYENIYPQAITRSIEQPIDWTARFGESYFITITGDKTKGYTAVLSE